MKKILNIIIEVELEVMVFDNYKKYSSLGSVRNKESDIFNFKKLVRKAYYNHKVFIRDPYSKEDDLISLALYLGITLNDLYNAMKNDVNLLANFTDFDKRSVITVHGKEHKNHKKYSIDQAPGLYTELAKVEPFDTNSIIKFSKTFGLPTGVRDYPIRCNSPNLSIVPIANYFGLNQDLIIYREAFHLIQRYIRKDINEIRKVRINEYKRVLDSQEDNRIIELFQSKINRFKTLDEKVILAYELDEIWIFYTELERQNFFESSMYENDKNHHIRRIYPNNLFGAAYLQLYGALLDKVELKKCKQCQHYFEASSGKMNFCPPLPFRKRSSCEMAFNNKKYRK